MGIFQFKEMPDSRETTGNPPSITLKYRASGDGAENESFVQAYAYSATPAIVGSIYGNLFRDDIKCNPKGHQLWEVTIPYVKNSSPTGSWTFNFDTTGGTFHIKASKATINRYGTAPDAKQLIGVKSDDVEGTDVVIPAFKINVTFKQPQGVVTLDYASMLADLTGMVNSNTFLRRQPGEVLFLGATGSDGSDAEAEVGFQFAVQKNLQGLIIGAITGITKDGWDIGWIRWKDAVDANLPVKQPEGVYIERVYDRTDLAAALGFGG